MAQRQRVGFQTRRLGVQIPLGSFMRAWSSLVMTPASHAGNPEFESRRAYITFCFYFNHACCNKMFVGRCAAGATGYAVTGNTHNAPPFLKTLYALGNVQWPLTWPGCRFDQKGTAPSVEQGHCTLIAVKRYRDPPRIGGRHNFLLRPYLWSPLTK